MFLDFLVTLLHSECRVGCVLYIPHLHPVSHLDKGTGGVESTRSTGV